MIDLPLFAAQVGYGVQVCDHLDPAQWAFVRDSLHPGKTPTQIGQAVLVNTAENPLTNSLKFPEITWETLLAWLAAPMEPTPGAYCGDPCSKGSTIECDRLFWIATLLRDPKIGKHRSAHVCGLHQANAFCMPQPVAPIVHMCTAWRCLATCRRLHGSAAGPLQLLYRQPRQLVLWGIPY